MLYNFMKFDDAAYVEANFGRIISSQAIRGQLMGKPHFRYIDLKLIELISRVGVFA